MPSPPDPKADKLRSWMMRQSQLQRTILAESLTQSGAMLESGRVVAWPSKSVHDPVSRASDSVEFSAPDAQRIGVYHTHPRSLDRPSLSIPDLCTVVSGKCAVMGVVGTEQAEYVVAPRERDDARVARLTADALGLTRTSALADVADSQVLPQPDASRRQVYGSVRQVLSPYIFTHTTGLSPRLTSASGRVVASGCDCTAGNKPLRGPGAEIQKGATAAKMRSRRCGEKASSTADTVMPDDFDVGEAVIGSAIGTIASNLVERTLFPR